MTAAWQATRALTMGPGWVQFVGHAGDNDKHAHHAIQLCLAPQPAQLEVELAQQFRVSGAGLILDKHVLHRLIPATHSVLLIYLDPESDIARCIRPAITGACTILSRPVADRILVAMQGSSPESFAERCTYAVLGRESTLPSAPSDPALQKVLDDLEDPLPDGFGLSELAALSHLSSSRCAHRIKALTGLPTRAYLRWRRLLAAVRLISAGSDVTRAAIDAGFSDAAHFSRSFKREFGITPSTFLGFNKMA